VTVVRRGWRSVRDGLAITLAGIGVLLLLAAPALGDRSFTTEFSTNDTGNIAITGNTVETCPTVASNCAAAKKASAFSPNSAYDNNSFSMQFLNTSPGTLNGSSVFDSSSADVALPTGATVLFAGLYWGGDPTAGSGVSGQPSPPSTPNVSLCNQVGFKVPGATTYSSVKASKLDISGANGLQSTCTTTRYGAFADVTNQVATAGNGTYSVANIQAAGGTDHYAGWSLLIVYHDSIDPPRNLTVDDGFQSVAPNSPPIQVPVGGFKTPPAGAVNTTLGTVTWEGDTGLTGDSLQLNNTTLSDAANPATNFFNGGIDNLGSNITNRNPADVNSFALDAKTVSANGVLANGATSATVTFSTNGDQYYPVVVSFATNLYAPVITSTKTVSNVTHPGGPNVAGDRLKYTVSYTNSGYDGASNFVMRDPIPGGTTFVPGSLAITAGPQAPAHPTDALDNDTGEFNAGANQVVFRLGSGANGTIGGKIAPGETDTVTFQVSINAGDADQQQIINQAHASYTGVSLGYGYTNDSPVVTTLVSAPDLTILKSHTGSLTGGSTIPFTISVANVGSAPTDGSTVKVTDTLPSSGFSSVVSASGDGWRCDVDGLSVTCTRSDVLAPGATYPPITVSAKIQPVPPMTLCNTAFVSGGGGNTSNNYSTDCDAGAAVADVGIQKFARPSVVYSAGASDQRGVLRRTRSITNDDLVTFTIPVNNLGPSTARNVVVTDKSIAASGGYVDIEATTTQGSCDDTVVCNLGDMPAFSSATVTITAQVIAHNTTLDNTATVSSDTADPVTDNNTASARVIVAPSADLAMTKTGMVDANGNPIAPTAGGPYTYTLTVANNGPDAATNLVVTDDLPADFTATSAGGGGFSCTLPVAPGGTIVCTSPSQSVADGPQQITVAGSFSSAATDTVLNVATVAADTADPDPSNNDATLVLPIGAQTILTISKEAEGIVPPANTLEPLVAWQQTQGSLYPGEGFYFQVVVSNVGPSPIGSGNPATVTDTLPSGIVYDPSLPASLTPNTPVLPSACQVVGQALTCTLSSIPAGGQELIDIPVTATTAGTYENVAAVSAPTDPNGPQESPPALAVVGSSTDLTLSKSVSPLTASVGETVTYTMTATNLGPSPTGALLTDVLPATLSFNGSADGCTAAGQTVTCGPYDLPALASQVVTFTAVVTPQATPGSFIVNSATIQSTAGSDPQLFPVVEDFNPQGNAAKTALVVPLRADLSIKKTVSHALVRPGEVFTYRLAVHNAGPATATEVKVQDHLPAGVGFSKASLGCVNKAAPMICTVGTLRRGATKTFVIRVFVLPHAPASITNSATVSGAQRDPRRRNNTSTVAVNVKQPPVKPPPVQHPPVQHRGRITLHDTPSATQLLAGHDVTFYLNASNPNAWRLSNVVICDRLPTGVKFVSGSPGVMLHAGVVCWPATTIAPGQQHVVSVRVATRAGVATSYVDAATVTSTIPAHLSAAAHAHVATVVPVACGSAASRRARADALTTSPPAVGGPLAKAAC
jgi:uncharacterized repeat protein (TIGR01451 family)